MKYILIALALALSGCATTDGFVKTDVVTKTEYVVRKATDQQKTIPPYPPTIDPAKATQLELAEWIAATEDRQWTLENIIKELVNFYEQPATRADQEAVAAKAAAAAQAASAPAQPAGTKPAGSAVREFFTSIGKKK